MKNLQNIELLFNNEFDLEKLKELTLSSHKELIKNEELMHEFSSDLPENHNFNDLICIFDGVSIYVNRSDRLPFFTVTYLLNDKNESPIFIYDLEFDLSGNIIDDYFDLYYK